ncbi:hypothetical protein FACS1894137_04380 [Spirochaetia bacterium]|nr:hypothetical protein FACS1894137_04380 [Spirochaetia bacterium]
MENEYYKPFQNILYKEKSPNKSKQKKSRPINLNIGIDFGTSYTKVCFSDSINSHNFVIFNNTEFKSSIIYCNYKDKIFYYNKPEIIENVIAVKYFKYSMISDDLPRTKFLSSEITDIRPEILCCVFFIACLIKDIKTYITKYYSTRIEQVKIDYSFTMGVPIENYANENRNLYDKVLNIAYKLTDFLTLDSISFSDLINFYKTNQNIKIMPFGQSNLNTLPELYAESLAFLQNRGVDTGVYALIDVGGGTVDMAILYKESPSIFSIISKEIQPLGIEIVSSKISIDINLIKKYLREMQLDSILQEQLRRTFAQMVMDLKGKKDDVLRSKDGRLSVIICGGGTNHKWYEDGIINKNVSLLRPILKEGLMLDLLAVEKLFPSNFNINHRLLVAYALSGRIGSEIVELHGYPWQFAEKSLGDSLKQSQYEKLLETQRINFGGDRTV